ncbi:tricorn protease [Ereboglobus sp. PH5-10]|uniref:S41 family peptidase n=1 Tax=Ereboglobus sp. PH5-10 TaxID=2940629 RepID=UPI002406F650|nr:S41 family peptidase [Ereboglobus sp. PH5-10]MDF9827329.1 tricorn protease [Ereboglobus sp. PH5-10]
MKRLFVFIFTLGCFYLNCAASAQTPANDTRLLRFPATNDTDITFSYAGQLYTVGVKGGVARRLTSGPGYAVFPRYSADGKQLAFTAQYDGNTEVYVMPANGGAPRRLTYSATLGRDDLADRMGPDNIVMTWRNTADEITYRSRWRSWDPFIGHLMSVNLDGNLPVQLPVPRGGFVTYSPDDTKIAYNRVFREFRTWKNYRGGMADDIWIYDLKTGALENITNNPAQDLFPMWAPNNRIYFVSERTGRANLFVYDPVKKQTRQLTDYTDYDVKFPSIGKKSLVYEHAGQIWRLNLATEKSAPVDISIREDLASARPVLAKVKPSSVRPSPDGKRVVVSAHGDVFTAPLKDGPVRNLTQTPAAHERDASWSPDGKHIAYLSDATGEFELYIRPQDGSGEPVQLTTGATTYYALPRWSPDSKKLLWTDREQRLRTIDIETKTITLVAHNPDYVIRQYAWSPDSALIAWTHQTRGALSRIKIFNTADGSTTDATDGWYAANSPAFSDDGQWLLFASARNFNPVYSDTEWNHAYKNMERIYMIALSKETKSPLAPRSDEVAEKPQGDASEKPDQPDKKEPTKKKTSAPPSSKLDPDGLASRIVALPVESSNYANLRMVGDRVFYQRRPGGPVMGDGGGEGFGATQKTRTVIAAYNLKERKETILGNYDACEITADGKKMLVRDKSTYALVDLPKDKISIKDKLDLSNLQLRIDRRAEWAQIFNESWRQMRDCFYAPNMHGIDWPAQRDKYAKLLPHVATRNDLTYLIGEMISELHAGHAYIGGGRRAIAHRIQTGLLGAQLTRDTATGYYQITKILRGENWEKSTRSPLTELGVNAREGDYLLAIDGKPTRDMPNPYAALVGTAGNQVTLRLASKPDAAADDARDIVIVPIADEAPLYYTNWVLNNIDYVAKKTGDRVGYLHIPDMGPEGLNEFVRRFYPQLQKEALIIDVRGNGGGNVSPMIIERLRRELVMINLARNGTPATNPAGMHLGPKVTLMDEYSASDGDIFPYRFREMGLGKLIGKRSWGGIVGITSSLPFMDGGTLNIPQYASYSKDGKEWPIEGYGVDPDIVVDNDPAREMKGEDQQLDRAIEEILAELKTNNPKLPPPPPWPVKPAK